MQLGRKDIEIIKELLVKDDYETLKSFLKRLFGDDVLTKADKKKLIKERAEKYRSELIKKQTNAELLFEIALKEHDIKYESQQIHYYNKRGGLSFYILDFYLPELKLAVEIDGGYHSTKKQKALDIKRDETITKSNIYKVFRFNNDEVYVHRAKLVNKILAYKPENEVKKGVKYKRRRHA